VLLGFVEVAGDGPVSLEGLGLSADAEDDGRDIGVALPRLPVSPGAVLLQ
jgi:hypothetical protein